MSKWHQKNRKGKKNRNKLYQAILRRDQGQCAICNKDNVLLLEILRFLSGKDREKFAQMHMIKTARLEAALVSKNGRLWDMDHIEPLAEGGETKLRNLRTLCIQCHLAITKIYQYQKKRKRLTPELKIFLQSLPKFVVSPF